MTKVENLSELRNKYKDKILGSTFSCFDLLHSGHYLFLEYSKSKCNILCVGLQTDPTIDRPQKNKPIQTLEEREIQVRGCRYIDYYFIYSTEQDLINKLIELQPDIRFLGDDYIGKRFTGDELPIKIDFHARSGHSWSSTNLRNRIKGIN